MQGIVGFAVEHKANAPAAVLALHVRHAAGKSRIHIYRGHGGIECHVGAAAVAHHHPFQHEIVLNHGTFGSSERLYERDPRGFSYGTFPVGLGYEEVHARFTVPAVHIGDGAFCTAADIGGVGYGPDAENSPADVGRGNPVLVKAEIFYAAGQVLKGHVGVQREIKYIVCPAVGDFVGFGAAEILRKTLLLDRNGDFPVRIAETDFQRDHPQIAGVGIQIKLHFAVTLYAAAFELNPVGSLTLDLHVSSAAGINGEHRHSAAVVHYQFPGIGREFHDGDLFAVVDRTAGREEQRQNKGIKNVFPAHTTCNQRRLYRNGRLSKSYCSP